MTTQRGAARRPNGDFAHLAPSKGGGSTSKTRVKTQVLPRRKLNAAQPGPRLNLKDWARDKHLFWLGKHSDIREPGVPEGELRYLPTGDSDASSTARHKARVPLDWMPQRFSAAEAPGAQPEAEPIKGKFPSQRKVA